VFVGTVSRLEPLLIFGFPLAWPFPMERRVTFAVKEGFRGVASGGARGGTVEVFTAFGCCACGMEFERGRGYLVYAYRNPATGTLSTSICSRTGPVEQRAEDLAYLRGLANPSLNHLQAARVYGFVTTDWGDFRNGVRASAPLASVPVSIRSGGRVWRSVTDGGGAYSLDGLAGGRFVLSAELPQRLGGGGPREVVLGERGCSEEIFVAVEQGEVAGRVVDDRGRPVRTTVELVPVALVPVGNGGGGKAARGSVSGYSGADGRFTIGEVGPGDYWLGVNYPGVAGRAAARRIHVESGQRLGGFEFSLPAALR
jgi:hypothetical protein